MRDTLESISTAAILTTYVINKWSAGCQVFKKIDDYNKFMELCKDSANIYGNGFTYTLITEKELRNHLDS